MRKKRKTSQEAAWPRRVTRTPARRDLGRFFDRDPARLRSSFGWAGGFPSPSGEEHIRNWLICQNVAEEVWLNLVRSGFGHGVGLHFGFGSGVVVSVFVWYWFGLGWLDQL